MEKRHRYIHGTWIEEQIKTQRKAQIEAPTEEWTEGVRDR